MRMLQVTTAPDGVGYTVESVNAVFEEDGPAVLRAILVEDGIQISASAEKDWPFETMAAARECAAARTRARGAPAVLAWETEA